MKKKILLVSFFCVTAVAAVVGLTTEKTMAQGGLDDPFWAETGESFGASYDYTVECTIEIGHETSSSGWGSTTTTTIKQTRTMQATGCAMVAAQACTPYSPC